MTRRSILVLLVLGCLVMLTGCATSRPDLEGAWMLVRPEPADAAHPTVKVLADGHFAFGRRTSGVPGPLAGGGSYRQEDGVYIETVEYHWAPALVGRTITFSCRIEDGRWIHQARFEAGGETFVIDEEWVRVAD